jgi:hypothetical protein
MNLKIKITHEKRRLLRLRRSLRVRGWCPVCLADSDFVSEKEIEQILESLTQTQNLHKVKLEDGIILICLRSLLGD